MSRHTTSIKSIFLSRRLSFWSIVVLFLVGTLFRWSFAKDVSAMLDCASCLLRQSFFYELQFLLIMLGLHQLACWLYWRWLGVVIRLCVLASLVIMLIDITVLRLFVVRFNWHELLKFSGELDAAKAFALQILNNPMTNTGAIMLIAGGLALSYSYVGFSTSIKQSKKSVYPWTVPLVLAVFMQPLQEVNFHTPYLENSLSAFFRPQTRLVRYENNPLSNAKAPAPMVPSQGLGKSPDLILLIVESMSSFHSLAFGKINNWTPQLDNWKQQGLSVEDFYANGITTEDGLVALLTGYPPLPRAQEGNLFSQYAHVANSIPKHLGKVGYRTAFLTTGNLSFMGKHGWLRQIGYQHIEGHEHPFYQGMPRFHFDAATDEALYSRAIQWIDQRHEVPFFLTLETVSTHQPFKNPVTGESSLESVVRYADTAMGNFLSQLSTTGFFDKGYVIITGDHRSMVPVSAEESQKFGDRAFAKIPLLVLGPGLKANQISGSFSQTDVLPTIKHLTEKDSIFASQGQGVMWPDALRKPDCLLTRRAYDLDLVIVQCGENNHPLKLSGNQTDYTDIKKGPQHWLDQVHAFRLGDGWRPSTHK